jgi:ABC-type transporter Mla subunit MlaD
MFTNIESVSESINSLIDPEAGVALRETLQNVRNFTARLDAVLDEENAALLDESISGLHAMATVFENNAAALEQILTDLSAASGRVPGAIDTLQQTACSLERMGNSLATAGDQLTSTMLDTQMEVRNVSQQLTPEALAVLSELRSVSASLERFVAELERDPSVLIYGRRATALGPGERNP